MKLYREVDPEEEMPKEHGYYLTNKGRLWADSTTSNLWTRRGNSQKYIDVNWWLEPIEITEEDIEEMIINSLAIMSNGEHRLIPEDYVKLPAQWILSKLKGE